ncbi:MAG TPA: sigma-70 family RNA polymerase sigma factor [Gemmatimonadales bacterium]|nr:sigma-70 family RNA polymerase sigma factor [Gemmatimonadales bacterium]
MNPNEVLSSAARGREPSDADIITRVLGGDAEAFGLIIRRYEGGLLRYATRMLGSADAAADAVAEGLVRAYRHLASCRDPSRLKSWLYRIVGNRCRSHLARRSSTDVSLEDAPPIVDSHDSVAETERADQLERVERALTTLSPEKREAFLLKHVEGLSYEEMAAATGERIPTLKMRVHRARAALLEVLKAEP